MLLKLYCITLAMFDKLWVFRVKKLVEMFSFPSKKNLQPSRTESTAFCPPPPPPPTFLQSNSVIQGRGPSTGREPSTDFYYSCDSFENLWNFGPKNHLETSYKHDLVAKIFPFTIYSYTNLPTPTYLFVNFLWHKHLHTVIDRSFVSN